MGLLIIIAGFILATIVVIISTIIWSIYSVFKGLFLLLRALYLHQRIKVMRRGIVVVGGDFARSPRMQYHAVSLCNWCSPSIIDEVALVGYDCGNKINEDLQKIKIKSNNTIAKSTGIVLDTTGLIKPVKLMPQAVLDLLPTAMRKPLWAMFTVITVLVQFVMFLKVLYPLLPLTVRTVPGSAHIEMVFTRVVMCQTPPAIPLLPILQISIHCAVPVINGAYRFFILSLVIPKSLVAELKKTGFSSRPLLIVDWHNLGYSLLEIAKRAKWMAKMYRLCEKWFGQGDGNLTVSEAMKSQLTEPSDPSRDVSCSPCNFLLNPDKVVVMYDRPSVLFRPSTMLEFLTHVLPEFSEGEVPQWVLDKCANTKGAEDIETDATTTTRVEEKNAKVEGCIVVSSTSWTVDDDYTCVVDALSIVSQQLQNYNTDAEDKNTPLRYLWLVCTGKGETKKRFEEQIAAAQLSSYIKVSTIYFQSYLSYARMLGIANIGLSAHQSSSGYDLPMKCVDMFGCGLPVVALKYRALSELIPEDESTGWLFENADQLANVIGKDALGLSKDEGGCVSWVDVQNRWDEKRAIVKERYSKRWDDEWVDKVYSLLQRMLKKGYQ